MTRGPIPTPCISEEGAEQDEGAPPTGGATTGDTEGLTPEEIEEAEKAARYYAELDRMLKVLGPGIVAFRI